ncbi:MAG: peroxin [Piccolia ochrophora]|nr:MAG: peroxin [Piccolia ochrophora]
MIAATRNWVRRNRSNFAIGFGLVGAGYVASQYVLSKLAEARERMSSDRIAKENLRRRFEQNQEDCTFTVLALLPTATENILEALPVESITHELQQKKAERLTRSAGSTDITPSELSSGPPSAIDDDGKSLKSFQSESYVHASQIAQEKSDGGEQDRPRRSKAQLWNDLKLDSVTRTFTILYTLTLLTLLTRIQLNLLGRRNYLSSVVTLASPPLDPSTISLENHEDADNLDNNAAQAYGNDFETNRRYLTFSWWLLHRGWRQVMEEVRAAVKEVFGPLNPREDISLARLSDLTLQVRRKIEGATSEERGTKKYLPYLLPPADLESFVLSSSGMPPSPSQSQPESSQFTAPTLLRHLLDETADLIDSPTFSYILTRLLDASFTHLVDTALATHAFKAPPPPPSPPAADPSSPTPLSQPSPPTPSPTAKLATVLAVTTRQAHAAGAGAANAYVTALEGVRELEAFAAVVYSSNFGGEVAAAAEKVGAGDEVEGEVEKEAEKGREEEQQRQGEAGEREEEGIESGFENVWGRVVEGTQAEAKTE